MSNKSLENKKRLFVKSSEKGKVAKKIKVENVSTTLLNSVVISTDNIDNSFEILCKQKCITDEKSLQLYDDIAFTGKIIQVINENIKILIF